MLCCQAQGCPLCPAPAGGGGWRRLEDDPTLLCLLADLVNCFNLVDRQVGLEEGNTHFPEILKSVKTCYGQPSHLMYGAFHISSECGWHQGDPLAGLLCCLVLLPSSRRLWRGCRA